MTDTEPAEPPADRRDARAAIRAAVWRRMRGVGRPDTRLCFDFGSFIPDFPGSERFPAAVQALPGGSGTGPLFVTPDNCLEALRTALVAERRPLLQTIAVALGFHFIDPDTVRPEELRFAGTLDGANLLGRTVNLEFVRALGKLDCVVTGACAVQPDTGIRYGKGHGFFDLEWAILSELGVVDERTPVIICVHDSQLVSTDLPPAPFDTAGDWIVTPTRTIRVARRHRNPVGVQWEQLTTTQLEEIAPLRELRALQEEGGREQTSAVELG